MSFIISALKTVIWGSPTCQCPCHRADEKRTDAIVQRALSDNSTNPLVKVVVQLEEVGTFLPLEDIASVAQTCKAGRAAKMAMIKRQLKSRETLYLQEIAMYQKALRLPPGDVAGVLKHSPPTVKVLINPIFNEMINEELPEGIPENAILVEEAPKSNAELRAMLQKCKQSRTLDLSKCPWADDETMKLIAQCPSLTRVVLSGNRNVTKKGIKALINGCPRLADLQLKSCKGVDQEVVDSLATLRHLKIVNLSQCGLTPETLKDRLVSRCPQLQAVILEERNQTTDFEWEPWNLMPATLD